MRKLIMSCKPDFIFIGPGRSGTTFLYHYLNRHPDVTMPRNVKEINYFNDNYYKKDFDWYLNFFRHANSQNAIGEIANMYIYDADVAQRIKEKLPDVKVITVLRNPYERVVSAYQYRMSVGEIPSMSFTEALSYYPDLIYQSCYATLLVNYLKSFDSSQIFILFYDDLKQEPKMFLEKVCDILSVEYADIELPRYLNNRRSAARSAVTAKGIRLFSDFLRNYHLYKIHSLLKNNRILRRVIFKDIKSAPIVSDDDKYQLEKVFRPEIQKLSAIVGRDLSHWMP